MLDTVSVSCSSYQARLHTGNVLEPSKAALIDKALVGLHVLAHTPSCATHHTLTNKQTPFTTCSQTMIKDITIGHHTSSV